MTGLDQSTDAPDAALQCGHGEDAVDDGYQPGEAIGIPALQCGHGEDAVDDQETQPWAFGRSFLFNVATARMPWMTGPAEAEEPPKVILQCGHGEDAVDDSRRCSGARRWP